MFLKITILTLQLLAALKFVKCEISQLPSESPEHTGDPATSLTDVHDQKGDVPVLTDHHPQEGDPATSLTDVHYHKGDVPVLTDHHPQEDTSVTCEGKTTTLSCGYGKITIHSANYGRTDSTTCSAGKPESQLSDTNCNTSTSLSTVKAACEGQSSCEVQAANSVFSDPCYGIHKYLKIGFSCSCPGHQMSVTCEWALADLTCGDGKIKVHSANYGRTDSTTCSEGKPESQLSDTNCHASTSLSTVASLCDGKSSCSFPAKNHVFSDPCVGIHKYLSITYSCTNCKRLDLDPFIMLGTVLPV